MKKQEKSEMVWKVKLESRKSELGFPMVPENLREWIFGEQYKISKVDQMEIKSRFSSGFKFPPEVEKPNSVEIELPEISPVEMVEKISAKYQVHKDKLLDFIKKGIPEKPSPDEILLKPGWTRYVSKSESEDDDDVFDLDFTTEETEWDIQKVDYPLESIVVIDVETMVKSPKNSPVMAVAVTNKAWYFWFNSSILNPNQAFNHALIPVGTGKIIVNHNPKFDSSKFRETYDLSISNRNVLFDTMSAHIAVVGMSSKQKIAYEGHKNGKKVGADKWAKATAKNNLVDVYNFHVAPLKDLTPEDKKLRKIFEIAENHKEIYENLEELIGYTLKDGKVTYELAQNLIPKYFRSQPSNITLGGHLELSKCILPVIEGYQNRLQQIDITYYQVLREIENSLKSMAKDWIDRFMEGNLTMDQIQADPFYSQVDWTPAKSGKNKGLPAWYRKQKSYTTKSNLAPLLLRMYWKGQPLKKSGDYGWVYETTSDNPKSFKVDVDKILEPGIYARIPHKDGDNFNCGNPLGKEYLSSIENGDLDSDNPYTKDLLMKAKSVSYWEAARKRAFSYHPHKGKLVDGTKLPLIEPTVVVHGTASRRMVESLWLTVPSAKPNTIGSELKGLVRPPSGYKLVGSDFDSQEMKIASFFSDALRKGVFGCTEMGYTTLTGDKKKGTDSHTLLSNQHNLPRDVAKKLNFQMLYLSGVKGCASTIKQYRPDLPDKEAQNLAQQVMKSRQGNKSYQNGNLVYNGGSDSDAYNMMLKICNREKLPSRLSHLSSKDTARTPILGAAISEAISIHNVGKDFLTSRANWTIQSTGVDLLHLFTTILTELFICYQVNGYLVIPVHDEIWSLVPDSQVELAAWCFQVAHLYSWTYLAYRLGFDDFPIEFCFFSEINVDTCLRKEVSMSQTTPSNSQDSDLPDGYTLNLS